MASKKTSKPFSKGDRVKVTRGAYKTKGVVIRAVNSGEGRGGGAWFEVDTERGSKRYRESNLSR